MNAATERSRNEDGPESRSVTGPIDGEALSIGSGFVARSFRAKDVGSAMDPLVLVDHYIMTEPTFGTHPHAGLSAVSLIFEDSDGRFHNRDSLGNDFDLLPGDLYWMKAGRGALHNESPREGSRTHGLQIFVNLPQDRRYEEPSSLLVRRQDMPLLSDRGYSVHVAMGESNGVVGATSPALPMTVLDGKLSANGSFEHALAGGRTAWVQAVNGDIGATVLANNTRLRQGQGIVVDNTESDEALIVRLSAINHSQAQFALLDGRALKEPYVQQGPFVMGSREEIDAANQAFNAGQFGSID
ncbi:MAG: pirin family protein [Pseudomonadota bacterium]